MQGPSEMSASGELQHWDRSADLGKIKVPVLTIGTRYDDQQTYFAGLTRFIEDVDQGRFQGCL